MNKPIIVPYSVFEGGVKQADEKAYRPSPEYLMCDAIREAVKRVRENSFKVSDIEKFLSQ